VSAASITLFREHSPLNLFIWFNEAERLRSSVAVRVNYAICFPCHSRHQLAPLSRLYIGTASIFGPALLSGTRCKAVTTPLLRGRENVGRGGKWLIAHLGAFKSGIIIRHCASWLRIEEGVHRCRWSIERGEKKRNSVKERTQIYFVWEAPGSFNYSPPV